MTYTITATATGPSASVLLPKGEFAATIRSATWGEAALEVSDDNATWYPAETYSGPLTMTGNKLVEIAGGVYYRLNVSTLSANIVFNATKAGVFTITFPDVSTDDLQSYVFSRYLVRYQQSKMFVGETVTLVMNLVKTDGTPATDLEGKTLQMVFETTAANADVLVIENVDIAVSGSTVTVEVGTPVTDTAGSYNWSIRELPGRNVIAFGQVEVTYVPIKD